MNHSLSLFRYFDVDLIPFLDPKELLNHPGSQSSQWRILKFSGVRRGVLLVVGVVVANLMLFSVKSNKVTPLFRQ